MLPFIHSLTTINEAIIDLFVHIIMCYWLDLWDRFSRVVLNQRLYIILKISTYVFDCFSSSNAQFYQQFWESPFYYIFVGVE